MVDVTREDERAANPYHLAECDTRRFSFGDCTCGVDEAFARHRLATRPAPDGEPVAYLYERDDGSKDLVLNCNGEYARRLIELGAVETPLFAHPPRNDAVVEALRETGRFLLDRLDELDWSLDMEDFSRDHAGHVDPAIARFRDALAALKQGEPR